MGTENGVLMNRSRMKLEYIPDADIDGVSNGLFLLLDLHPSEVKALIAAIRDSLIEQRRPLHLDTVEFIHTVNEKLELVPSDKDAGIRQVPDSKFVCELTTQGYTRIIELMEPFTLDGTSSHQWLYDLPTKDTRIEFLLSTNGQW